MAHPRCLHFLLTIIASSIHYSLPSVLATPWKLLWPRSPGVSLVGKPNEVPCPQCLLALLAFSLCWNTPFLKLGDTDHSSFSPTILAISSQSPDQPVLPILSSVLGCLMLLLCEHPGESSCMLMASVIICTPLSPLAVFIWRFPFFFFLYWLFISFTIWCLDHFQPRTVSSPSVFPVQPQLLFFIYWANKSYC